MHVILWSFRARPGLESRFEDAYGAGGAWARLFAAAPGFLGSELMRASDGRYLTVDRWESKDAFEAFREAHAAAYAELDARCDALTAEERSLGTVEA